MGKVPRYEVPAHQQNILGQASGVLVGGNLCTFAPNVGSRADATKGKDLILFVEEIGENMRNIDRQMRLLKMLSSWKKSVRICVTSTARCAY